MNYDDIGRFIQEKRKGKNLTQKDLAKRIGVTDKAVSKWERGLGCPDVSILEILSKELGCSILELLKGKEIEGKVIPVTEADDYIKTGIHYSESNFKRIVCKLIVFILLFIFTLLLILNIINMYNQRKKHVFDFNPVHKELVIKVNNIKKNISIIKSDKGNYSKDDYEKIVKHLKSFESQLDDNLFIKYDGTQKMTLNDLYVIDAYYIRYMELFNTLNILKEYSTKAQKYYDELVEVYAMRMYLGGPSIGNTYEKLYRYELKLPYESWMSSSVDDQYDMRARSYDISYALTCYLNVTNMIIEVGDIHE